VDQAQVALSRAIRKLQETTERAKQAQADLEISIQQADESINSLRIKATNVSNKAERQKHLLSRSATSQEEYETAQTDAAAAGMEFRTALLAKQELKNRGQMLQTEQEMNIEAAQDAVDSAKIALKNAQVRLSSTTMVSPMDGIVSDVKTAPNDWLVPSGEFGRQAVMNHFRSVAYFRGRFDRRAADRPRAEWTGGTDQDRFLSRPGVFRSGGAGGAHRREQRRHGGVRGQN